MSDRPSDNALSFEAVKVSLRQDRNGFNLVLSVHPSDIPDELVRSWVGARYQVALVQIGDDERPIPIDKPKQISHTEGEASLALAGELCRTPGFQEWLGMPDEDETAQQLRLMLGIKSRKELLTDESAQTALKRLFKAYRDDTGISDSGIPEDAPF